MRINKTERRYLVRVLMSRGLSKTEANERIDEDNGYLRKLTNELKKKKNNDRKERTKRFKEEFRKLKSKSLNKRLV